MKTVRNIEGRDVPALEVEDVQTQLSFLLGKILTITEASFSDKEQRKAVKDLVRAAFNDKANYIHQIGYGNGSLNAEGICKREEPKTASLT